MTKYLKHNKNITTRNSSSASIIEEKFLLDFYKPIFRYIRQLKQDKLYIISIDGRCGAGKTTLASLISSHYNCNVFHTDDFFLTKKQRTEQRLAEPGGNIDYERFRQEVLTPLVNKKEFIYRAYRCSSDSFYNEIEIKLKNLNIIEGSYSHHPLFKTENNFKIFLNINKNKQLDRIIKRNGYERYKVFQNKWIPMEELYFSHFSIPENSDMVFNV